MSYCIYKISSKKEIKFFIIYKKKIFSYKTGEGLGKERNGSLTPLLLELKLDKRGLEANAEV